MLPMEQLKGWSGRTGTRAVTWANQVGSCDLEWLGLTKPACNETHLPWIMWPACRTVVVKWQQRGRRATTLVFQQKFYGKNGFCHKSFAQIPEHYLGVTTMMVSLLVHTQVTAWAFLLLLENPPSNQLTGNRGQSLRQWINNSFHRLLWR